MKKIIAIFSIVATMLALTACGSFTCDECGQKKSGKKHTMEMFGQKITMCNDCYKLVGGMIDALGNLGK